MKFENTKLIMILMFLSTSVLAQSHMEAQRASIQVICGDLQKDLGVQFDISPEAKTMEYKVFQDGRVVTRKYFKPGTTMYDYSGLSYSEGENYSVIKVKGVYAHNLRITFYNYFSLQFVKNSKNGYTLASFKEGVFRDTYSNEEPSDDLLQENSQFLGLECRLE